MQSNVPPLPISRLLAEVCVASGRASPQLLHQQPQLDIKPRSNAVGLAAAAAGRCRQTRLVAAPPPGAGSSSLRCSPYKNSSTAAAAGQPPTRLSRLLMHKSHKTKVVNVVDQRLCSAKMLKIKQLQNQLADAHFHLNELSNENKLLKVIQKRQDAALRKYEGSSAELPRIISTHHEDFRVLEARYKKLKAQHKDASDALKDKESELLVLQLQNKKLLQLSKDRHLGEREKLQIQVSDLNHRINQQDEIIQTLKRKLSLETKYLKHQLHVEILKHKETHKKLGDTECKLRNLEALMELREKRSRRAAAALACSTNCNNNNNNNNNHKQVAPTLLNNANKNNRDVIRRDASGNSGVNCRTIPPGRGAISTTSTSQSLTNLTEPSDNYFEHQLLSKKLNKTKDAPVRTNEFPALLLQAGCADDGKVALTSAPAAARISDDKVNVSHRRRLRHLQHQDSSIPESLLEEIIDAHQQIVEDSSSSTKFNVDFAPAPSMDRNNSPAFSHSNNSRLLHARLISAPLASDDCPEKNLREVAPAACGDDGAVVKFTGGRFGSSTLSNSDHNKNVKISTNGDYKTSTGNELKDVPNDSDSPIGTNYVEVAAVNDDCSSTSSPSAAAAAAANAVCANAISATSNDNGINQKPNASVNDSNSNYCNNDTCTSSRNSDTESEIEVPMELIDDDDDDNTFFRKSDVAIRAEGSSAPAVRKLFSPCPKSIDKIIEEKKKTVKSRSTRVISKKLRSFSTADLIATKEGNESNLLIQKKEENLKKIGRLKISPENNPYESSNTQDCLRNKTVIESPRSFDKAKLLAAMKAIDDNENIEFVEKKSPQPNSRLKINDNLYGSKPLNPRTKK